MSVDGETAEWQRLVVQYEEVIAKFEQTRLDLLKRRGSATKAVGLILDERLKLNDCTLKALREGLATAKKGMRRLEQDSAFDSSLARLLKPGTRVAG
jgi:hypothetical protein